MSEGWREMSEARQEKWSASQKERGRRGRGGFRSLNSQVNTKQKFWNRAISLNSLNANFDWIFLQFILYSTLQLICDYSPGVHREWKMEMLTVCKKSRRERDAQWKLVLEMNQFEQKASGIPFQNQRSEYMTVIWAIQTNSVTRTHTHRARGRGTLNFQASLCGGVYAKWKPQNSKQFNTRHTLHSLWSLYCTTMMMLANVAQPAENCEEKWINLLVELIVSGLEWGRSDAFVASICSSFFPKAALLPSHRCNRYGAI